MCVVRSAAHALLACLVLAAGCQGSAPTGASCSTPSDCPAGLTCRFGRCRTGCEANRDCAPGGRCLRGADGVGACSLDQDLGCEQGVGRVCAAGLLCVGGRCESTCASSAECPSDGVCQTLASGVGFCFDTRSSDDAGVPPPPTTFVLAGYDTEGNDGFGDAVAMSADGMRLVVGAPQSSSVTGREDNTAHVFVRSATGWIREWTFVESDITTAFGADVAIDGTGTRVAVSEAAASTPRGMQTGVVHVYLRTGASWAEEATLSASDGGDLDTLGSAVALSADGAVLLAGVPLDDTAAGADAGSARVFVRAGTTWSEAATLIASDGAASDDLGTAVALSADGHTALAGAPQDLRRGTAGIGSVHVFSDASGSWQETTTLAASNGRMNDRFGSTVAVSSDGSLALVAATSADAAAGNNVGRVYAYDFAGTWLESAIIEAPASVGPDARFGSAIALDAAGTIVVIGALWDPVGGLTRPGSAHVFTRDGRAWTQGRTVLLSPLLDDAWLGTSASVDAAGRVAAIGADHATIMGVDGGGMVLLTSLP